MGHGRGSARRVLRSWFIVFCSGLKVGTAEPRGGSGWRLAVGNTDEAAVENRKSIEMRATVRERTAGDSDPYLAACSGPLHLLPFEQVPLTGVKYP